MNIEELHVLFCIKNNTTRVTPEGLPFYKVEYTHWLEDIVLKSDLEKMKNISRYTEYKNFIKE